MNSLLNDVNNINNISHKSKLDTVNIKVNKIKQLINNDNINIRLNKNTNEFCNNDMPLTTNCSKSFNEKDNTKNNVSNFKRIFNYKDNKNLIKKRMNQTPYEIKESDYIFSLAMNNLHKYKDNLVKETKTNISNQINNKKFTNNIINYCLINPNNSYNKNNNNFYNIDNDDIFINENGKNFPIPEPTPIKISKSSNNINQIKNISLYLKQNIKRNNNNNNNDYNFAQKYNNNDYKENIKTDYCLKNNLNNYYNNTFANENNKLILNHNRNLSQINYNNNDNDNNNNVEEEDNKLIYILNNLNLSYLIDSFKKNYVSFNDLFLLTREDFVEMKIPVGPRNKIIHFIQEYKKYMKSFEFNDLSNFLNFYKTNNLIIQEQKIENNNIYSTTQTTNDFSNRIKTSNPNKNNYLSNEKKDDNLQKSNCNNIYYNNIKNNNIPKNSFYSLINSSNNFSKTSSEKNNINRLKRNNSSLINLKTTSYMNPNINKYHKNNSVIGKDKIFNPYYKKENQNNKKNENISYKYNKIENTNKNFKKNIKKSRPVNKQNFRNPLMKLIEDTQTNKTYSTINGQIMNQINSNLTNNIQTKKIINNKNVLHNNQTDKEKKKKSEHSNIKIENNSNYYNKNEQNINFKIIETFKSLNNEVENFQNKYKRLKKASYERENKIKNILMGDRCSSLGNLKFLNQQIKNLSTYNGKDINIEKKANKNLVFKNICQNKNIVHLQNNSEFNNKKNTLIYELNIDNVK